jgi:hypothetical protein
MHSKLRLPRSGMAFSVLFASLALTAGASSALADNKAGLIKLPNVRIVTATPAQIAEDAKVLASTPAVRAYKDPVSGELRDQTPEEMMDEGHTKAAHGGGAKATFISNRGSTIFVLDESSLTNAVVTRGADGKMHMQCVTGQGATIEAMLKGSVVKGDRHDH